MLGISLFLSLPFYPLEDDLRKVLTLSQMGRKKLCSLLKSFLGNDFLVLGDDFLLQNIFNQWWLLNFCRGA